MGGWEGTKGGSGRLGGEVDWVDGWAWLIGWLGGFLRDEGDNSVHWACLGSYLGISH